MKFTIQRRDFTENPVILDLDFTIERYSWDVIGGPNQATITATGGRDQLFALVNHMRAPVEIISDKGERVWWGYLATLDINWGAIRYGIDIDQMSNTVAVAYTYQNIRYTTQWSADADSVLEYGTKEILLSRSDATDVDAIQQRDTYLAGAKYPIPTLQFRSGASGSARITCRGWFNTLDWRYYENSTGFEGYTTSGSGGREVGEDDRPILAMSLMIGATEAWVASSLWLRIWRQGTNTPGDSLNVSLCADSSGVPGTALATATILGSSVPTRAEWIEFTLSAPVALATATTYFIKIERSGAIDPDAYYMIDTNTNNGYPRGNPIYYNTNMSAWVDASHKGDVLFKVVGGLSTTYQMSVIVTSIGQFFAGTQIETESGINTVQYRTGDSTGLYELLKLMLIGTSNARRMLAEVSHNRYLRIYEEAVKPTLSKDSYGLDGEGLLYFQNGAPVDMELCLTGIWCHLIDVIPATVDLSVVADPGLFFIDAAEYDVQAGQYNILRTREQSSSFDIGGVEQG